MNQEQISDLAYEASNEAIRVIQDRLGVRFGDFAGIYFCGDRLDDLMSILSDYIRAEISEGMQ